MKTRIIRYLKHIFLTVLILATVAVLFGLYHGAGVHYGDNSQKMNWDHDGPYVFYTNDSTVQVNYIRGDKHKGFYLDQKEYATNSDIQGSCFFPLDSSSFKFSIKTDFKSPKVSYNDANKILAISDIESGYKTFRDFLIRNKVIDEKLHWTFGKGHLVLVGDFVDRGFSTTQVLWFIYKLEQEALIQGGQVHFIIGNHELKNMHGNFDSASPKYNLVAAILGKTQQDLYSLDAVLGKWMASKNALELINGHLFVHGGIHPDMKDLNLNLEEVNTILRASYSLAPYPKKDKSIDELIISSKTGPCWYRGYYKDDLTQEEVERGLNVFGAKAVIVGHTIQSKVNAIYKGKVIGIDVQHPKDYHKNWPNRKSEGLLIENGVYYRVFDTGKLKELYIK